MHPTSAELCLQASDGYQAPVAARQCGRRVCPVPGRVSCNGPRASARERYGPDMFSVVVHHAGWILVLVVCWSRADRAQASADARALWRAPCQAYVHVLIKIQT